MSDPIIRNATNSDVDALLELEQQCFAGDRLSRRSFKRFLKPGPHQLAVMVDNDVILAYSLLLFRSGTSLARLYSIALSPQCRGRGLASLLLDDAHNRARQANCVFLRLEVREDNAPAIALYRKKGYACFDTVDDYYEDGGKALRFEKRLNLAAHSSDKQMPNYYAQTTDFSCGPAALMMAMHSLDTSTPINRSEELQLWREATTIFMTAGHGGCSPHGLALAALRRHFAVTLYINTADTPFIDSVRSDEKRSVIELVHQQFLTQLAEYNMPVEVSPLGQKQFREILEQEEHLVALISTWALNRNKAPHWVYINKSDQNYVYVNDPDTDDTLWQTEADCRHVPVSIDAFIAMASFGRRRLRCLLAIHPKPGGTSNAQ